MTKTTEIAAYAEGVSRGEADFATMCRDRAAMEADRETPQVLVSAYQIIAQRHSHGADIAYRISRRAQNSNPNPTNNGDIQ